MEPMNTIYLNPYLFILQSMKLQAEVQNLSNQKIYKNA